MVARNTKTWIRLTGWIIIHGEKGHPGFFGKQFDLFVAGDAASMMLE